MIIEETWLGNSGEALYLWNAAALMQKYANPTDSMRQTLSGRELEKKMIELAVERLHPSQTIVKNEFGKPYWENQQHQMPHMNYSHSKDMLFWGEHPDHRMGVDIEYEREQLLRIKHKFCTNEELEFCRDNIQQILLVWSAKESMYKAYGQKEIDFKEQMKVWNFEDSSNQTHGLFQGQLTVENNCFSFELEFRRKSPFIMTWTHLNLP